MVLIFTTGNSSISEQAAGESAEKSAGESVGWRWSALSSQHKGMVLAVLSALGFSMKAIFVKNLRLLDGDKKNTYEGDQMSVDEAYAFFVDKHSGKTPLFFVRKLNRLICFIHDESCERELTIFFINLDGYNNEIAGILKNAGDAQVKLYNSKHVIVPVIWPSEGSFAYCNEDRYVILEIHFSTSVVNFN